MTIAVDLGRKATNKQTTESNRRGVPYGDGSKAIIRNVLQVTPLCDYFT